MLYSIIVPTLLILTFLVSSHRILLFIQVYPMKPEEFASILIEKLELVRHEQDAQEKLDRKLQEVCEGDVFHCYVSVI